MDDLKLATSAVMKISLADRRIRGWRAMSVKQLSLMSGQNSSDSPPRLPYSSAMPARLRVSPKPRSLCG